ncbi:hypothetical protein KPH14_004110 [Odynerus spinipes]|uniref:Uncharacterized protein n=1 Tax=Odynerus spinipes TaxID=1348599 RepID=A0AAD9RYP5_9HYME|nr:hypothetical protein KPH14_004110 [Odynerus spinipes]
MFSRCRSQTPPPEQAPVIGQIELELDNAWRSMRRRAKIVKVALKKGRAKVSAKNIPEKINAFDNDAAGEHIKRRNKIIETLQQVQTYDVKRSSYDSNCTYFNVTHTEEEIYSPVLEDFLTELNISKLESGLHIEENSSFPAVCSYCKHISMIPKHLIKSINNTTLSPLSTCKADLNFLQAIVWLKSVAARMHEIPAKEYDLIFNVFTNASEYNVSKCRKKIIETNFAVSKEQNPKDLDKENRNSVKINDIDDSLDNNPLTPQRWNDTWTGSKCVLQSLLIPESDEELTMNSQNVDDSFENISLGHNESNISVKHDSAYETLDVDRESVDLFLSSNEENQQKCLQKKRKIEIEDMSKKRKKYIKENISSEWVNFTLRTWDTDNVVIESIKIILTAFKDMNIIKEYFKRKNWVDTLEKEALDAILNVSHIFRIEMKSNICAKEVIQAIKDILEEIYQVTDLNKITLQIHHISIILEFCNDLYICNEITNFLMIKLQHFQITLKSILTKQLNGFHNIINKVDLVLYALGICLQKYMSNICNNGHNSKQDIIPAVINLWRKQWNIDRVCSEKIKEQKNIESWVNSLEAFTMTYMDDIPLLAEKSRQLYHILIV